MHRALQIVVVSMAVAFATSCGNDGGDRSTSASTPVPAAESGLAAFADEADAVCAQMVPRFQQLRDPDGEGGQKPLGLGRLVEEGFTELGRVRPPDEYAARWDEAIGLLVESGRVLTEAEELAADGAEAASEAAQSRALFDLQPSAHELVEQIDAPFGVCFAERSRERDASS